MDCPYCLEPIKDNASVCPHCGSNLGVITPTLARLAALEARLALVEAGLANPATAGDVLVAKVADPAPLTGTPRVADSPPRARQLSSMLLSAVTCLALLLGCHAAIVLVLDWPVILLRVLCICIPLVCAARSALRGAASFGASLVVASSLAVLAVVGMSAAVTVIDHVPTLPRTGRDWREFLEFAFSIAMAWQTGYLLGRHASRPPDVVDGPASGLMHVLALSTCPPGASPALIEQRATVINTLFRNMGPALTASTALLSGVRALLQ